ncbi:helix-turn-helix domain-containing protein [Streptococcus mitis]|uniref:Helix-turn-helix domain-containing protein n=1 Tax=Streptococcus mitis TaxID=28037 RepID=A0A6I1TX99_STRMT|nr:helix-turn-helix transcriptional regulator [Streptococcus mitis]MQQ29784.1 helix-turn-helix domain-containing protein [Streptococcus mitis]DAN07143.1 MAG TPA: helix-turn-helix domain protein [Caudoviricetes sp.]
MIGKKIKQLREEQGLSQDELAEKSGVSRMTITYLETGVTKDVKLGTLNKIAVGLNVALKDFM